MEGGMTEFSPATRDGLSRVGTSTLTGILSRRGLRNMFMQDVWPIRPDMPRMVGPAFTMRFIPAREDKTATGRGPVQRRSVRRVTCSLSTLAAIRGRRRPAISIAAGCRRAAAPVS
jgi:hypothetical protein